MPDAGGASAQTQTFDLVTYSPPQAKGWKKEINENTVLYTIINNAKKTWCRIALVKSTTSKGNIEQDFESEWQELVVKNYNPAEAPNIQDVQEKDGWKIKAGSVQFTFNNAGAVAMLTTISGYERCASIVATTNSDNYLKDIEAFLSSVDIKKPATETPVVMAGDAPDIVGIWGMTSSDNSAYAINNGINGYIKRQYHFNADGTYDFAIKTFSYLSDKLLLTRESGHYTVKDNAITITPKSSVIESWSKDSIVANGKRSGTDNWGKLVSRQKRTLEKITYQFSQNYLPAIEEHQLILQAGQPTQRDGPFNGGADFVNSWFYKRVTTDVFLIKLPE